MELADLTIKDTNKKRAQELPKQEENDFMSYEDTVLLSSFYKLQNMEEPRYYEKEILKEVNQKTGIPFNMCRIMKIACKDGWYAIYIKRSEESEQRLLGVWDDFKKMFLW